MMLRIILVGVGSLVGGMLRYGLATWVHRVLGGAWFPYGTLVVNVLGCLLIGFLTGLGQTWMIFSTEMRLFLFVGVLGGFTTFSAFALETFALAQDSHPGAAVVNIALQLLLGLLAVWVGILLSHAIGDRSVA